MSSPKMANVFNNTVLAFVIYRLYNHDFFSHFEHPNQFVDRESLPIDLQKLIPLAFKHQLIELDSNKIQLTVHGHEAKIHVGYFVWLIGGYSGMLSSTKMNKQLQNDSEVAIGSSICYNQFMSQKIGDVLSKLVFKSVADLGCGIGDKLIYLASENENFVGLGIDSSLDAIQLAKKANKNNTVDFIHADILELINKGQLFPGIDVVTSFMSFHDLLNSMNGNKLIEGLLSIFPDVKTLIIADSFKEEANSYSEIFTSGFELVHLLNDISIYSVTDYRNIFQGAGLCEIEFINLGVPNTYLFHLQVTNSK